ncbi:hypothetical protein M422DRAFT_778666 [Sphaerobolus stellatus SS14]|uniref:Uncharacterized protein n=1 Tax=Sphaerobolus stellatus (strain SS14) TaxID=990650 RepID=A0A0C9VTK4_SPHS4|nr:hypothetical protein M422DRAFT_778666 [Sphaerobolus stellatus SS14]
MRHLELGVIPIIAAVLPLLSLPAHIRVRGIPTISLSLWLFISSLIRGIGALVWADNVDIRLEVWCDISTKILMGFVVAVPGASMCLMRQISIITSLRTSQRPSGSRKERIIEVFFCLLFPCIYMVLHYVVQGRRFDIIETLGCTPTFVISWVSILLIFVSPLLMSVVGLIYGGLIIWALLRRRRNFKATPSGGSSASSNPARYTRLFFLSSVVVMWETALIILTVVLNVKIGLDSETDWNFVHYKFSRIRQLPRFLISNSSYNSTLALWLVPPIAAVFFFLCFATGQEAMKDYRIVFGWFKRVVFRCGSGRQVVVSPYSIPSKSWTTTETFQRKLKSLGDTSDGMDNIYVDIKYPPQSYSPASKKLPSLPMASSNSVQCGISYEADERLIIP